MWLVGYIVIRHNYMYPGRRFRRTCLVHTKIRGMVKTILNSSRSTDYAWLPRSCWRTAEDPPMQRPWQVLGRIPLEAVKILTVYPSLRIYRPYLISTCENRLTSPSERCQRRNGGSLQWFCGRWNVSAIEPLDKRYCDKRRPQGWNGHPNIT